MDDKSIKNPLLLSQDHAFDDSRGVWVSWVNWVLKIVMWVVFVSWVGFIFLYPAEFGNELFEKLTGGISATPFGITGGVFMVFSGPVLIIAILAIIQLIISGEEVFQKKKASKSPKIRLWTFPVLVDGPFGVVSATELIGILVFAVFFLWSIYAYTMRNISLLPKFHLPPQYQSNLLLELTGLRLGMIGLLCLAFLFLPIARSSVLLRLIDIPFEHATRYHVWLGHITMLFFTLHGLCFVIVWAMEGRLLKELLAWKDIGVANLPGVISLLAGLLMWVTSLHRVRKQYFELFFYTHQLYVVFVVFLALHVGDFIFSIAAGGIFLFILDRFLRFCQSRKTVDVVSAKCLPCGTVELLISKPRNLRYNALSFVFLQVRELSWLQWHPFSVSSSPLDGNYHLAILIKVLGGWTAKLRDSILRVSEAEPKKELKITASVEGPYGHESPYHLMYENLILVAGGIGISPFLAIIRDILHRIREGKPCLPRKLMVVWAIKSSNELSLLSAIDVESICPFFADKLKLWIDIYVTRESQPPLEEGLNFGALSTSVCRPVSTGRAMSVLVGTGDDIWSGLYVIMSTIGFIVLLAVLDIFYIKPYKITTWWYKGLLFLACMVMGVLAFGGVVIGLWHLWSQRVSSKEAVEVEEIKFDNEQRDDIAGGEDFNMKSLESLTNILYGSRPDFKDIFGSIDEKWGGVDVGVIVCGPPALQTSVAKEIRSFNLRRSSNSSVFHFNSHSFDL